MTKFAIQVVLLASFGAAFVPVCGAQSDNEYKVGPHIRVRWNTSTKAMEWAPGSTEDYSDIGTGTVFLSKGATAVTYPRVNPLRVQVNASVVALPDPTAAILERLGTALNGLVTTLVPAPSPGAKIARVSVLPGSPAACSVDGAKDAKASLVTLLYQDAASAAYFKQEATAWKDSIETALNAGSPADAIRDVAGEMRADATALKSRIDRASEYLVRVRECAGNSDKSIADPYQSLLLAGGPESRFTRLEGVRTVFLDLADALTTRYAPAERWIGSDYRVTANAVLATSQNMQKVTLTVTTVSLTINDFTDAVTPVRTDLGSSEFTVRKYALFVPEVGVGAVFAKITPPKYGTAVNDKGQTVVARATETSVSVNPTILVNFVCRCELGPLAPMLQVGSSVSKDTPALLLGGGLRLFSLGKGAFAIGGGAMFAWVKDLQTLKPGSVVTGTKDIEADLGFSSTPRIRGYLTLQYKF